MQIDPNSHASTDVPDQSKSSIPQNQDPTPFLPAPTHHYTPHGSSSAPSFPIQTYGEKPFIFIPHFGIMHDPWAPDHLRCHGCTGFWNHIVEAWKAGSPSLYRAQFDAWKAEQPPEQGLIADLRESEARNQRSVDEAFTLNRELVKARYDLRISEERVLRLEGLLGKSRVDRSKSYIQRTRLLSEKKHDGPVRGMSSSSRLTNPPSNGTHSSSFPCSPADTSYITLAWIQGVDTIIFIGPGASAPPSARTYPLPDSDSLLSAAIRTAHLKGYNSDECRLMRQIISELQGFKADQRTARENWLLKIWKSPARPDPKLTSEEPSLSSPST